MVGCFIFHGKHWQLNEVVRSLFTNVGKVASKVLFWLALSSFVNDCGFSRQTRSFHGGFEILIYEYEFR